MYISFVLEKNLILEDAAQVQLLSKMIGVSVEDIISYIEERKGTVKSG